MKLGHLSIGRLPLCSKGNYALSCLQNITCTVVFALVAKDVLATDAQLEKTSVHNVGQKIFGIKFFQMNSRSIKEIYITFSFI